MTIAEAAPLGLSSDTIRRRIRRGELRAQQVPTRNGPAWRVVLGVLPRVDGAPSVAPSVPPTLDNPLGSAPSGTPGSAAGQESAALLRALDLADRLQRENLDLAGLVGSLQPGLVFAEDHIQALEAPDDAQDANLSEEDENAAGAIRATAPLVAFWRA